MWAIKTKVAIPVLLCTDIFWMFLKEVLLDVLKTHTQKEGVVFTNQMECLFQSNKTTIFLKQMSFTKILEFLTG